MSAHTSGPDPIIPRGRLLFLDAAMLDAPPDELEISLHAAEQVVGRERGCTVVLRSPTLSRRHARLFPGPAGWGVEDLNSTNGVFVNGRRVTAAWLNDGDELRIGPVPFRYLSETMAVGGSQEQAEADQTILARPYMPVAEPVRVLRRRLIAYGHAADLRDSLVREGLAADYDVLAVSDLAAFAEHLLSFSPSLAVIGMTETPDDADDALDAIQKEAPKIPVVLITDRPFTRVVAVMALAEQRKLAMLRPLPYPCPPAELAAHLAAIPAPETPLSANDLAVAIRERQIIVHFQPKVDLRHSEPVGAEVLVRWRHPERGMIPPDRFIALAERSGLISDLTYAVVAATISTIHRLNAMGWSLTMSINVSARSLVDMDFPRRIREMLQAEAVPPHQITFEVTESAAMLRVSLIRQVLADLRGRGFGISLDDFGTGYSTLEELHRMPFSELKVDKQFVMSLLEDPGARAITESTINLAHNLGLQVVAEGVETAETYERLKRMGCDLAQGYFISQPLSGDDLHDWLTTR